MEHGEENIVQDGLFTEPNDEKISEQIEQEEQIEESEQEEIETFVCEHCHNEYDIDNMLTLAGHDYCENCYDSLTCTCEHCGDTIYKNDAVSDDDKDLCRDCYNDHYHRCEDCNYLVHEDDVIHYGGSQYCSSCYDDLDRNDDDCDDEEKPIKCYNYKPEPIFYGDKDDIYYGIELEVDDAGENNSYAEEILQLANSDNEHIYIKHDGSLSNGFEIVTHPMTLAYHSTEMCWQYVLQRLVRLGYLSHKTTTCGYHIHVERKAFGEDDVKQEKCFTS